MLLVLLVDDKRWPISGRGYRSIKITKGGLQWDDTPSTMHQTHDALDSYDSFLERRIILNSKFEKGF